MNVLNNRRKLNVKSICIKPNKQFNFNHYNVKITSDFNYNKLQMLSYTTMKPDNECHYSTKSKYTNIE